MTAIKRSLALATFATVLATPIAVQATDARYLDHVRGMSSYDGERELRSRGFDRIRTERAGQSEISFWWDNYDCVRVDEYDGRLVSIVDADDRDCEDRSRYSRDRYDRRDWRSDRLDDLQGVRASSAMDELERRGFEQVDNYTSGYTRYSIQWRARSRQCVQVAIEDGRIADIRDIERSRCESDRSRPSYGRDSRDDTVTPPPFNRNWYVGLIGGSATAARGQLRQNGFERMTVQDDGEGSIWYNRSQRQCIQLLTSGGRVLSMEDLGLNRQCR